MGLCLFSRILVRHLDSTLLVVSKKSEKSLLLLVACFDGGRGQISYCAHAPFEMTASTGVLLMWNLLLSSRHKQ